MRAAKTRLLILFLLLSGCLLAARDNNSIQRDISKSKYELESTQPTQIIMSRIKGPVTLDGLSNESAWEGVEPVPTVEFMPNFGRESSERTEILFAFDEDYLYVAGRLYDSEPDKIQNNSKQRDSSDPTCEWFGVVIDTFNDKENAMAFFTTPAGLRWDATVLNDAYGDPPINMSWNTFWDVATAVTGDGWFAEFRIPFSSLRFQDRNGRVVIGLISWRLIARKNEFVIFPAIPPNWGSWSRFKPSKAQEFVLEDVYTRKPLYIAPYFLGGRSQLSELTENQDAYERKNEFEHEPGLDIKYGLTSNLTLDVTLNTDFAQVEADDQQVNLTRFSLFFPEKRLFFQERSSNFDFNFGGSNRLFYSRRIGLHDGQPVRIYGGARLVGRIGDWDLGFLSMQTAPVEDLSSENLGVLRMRRRVFNPYSYAGGIVTTRIGVDGTFNIAYGLDGIFRLFGNDYLTVKWAQTFETGQTNNPLSLPPSRFYLNWERRTVKGFGYSSTYSYSGSDYNPGIGFQLRDNFSCFWNVIKYGWFPKAASPIFHQNFIADWLLVLSNATKKPESANFILGYEFVTKSGFSGRILPTYLFEDVPAAFPLSDKVEVPSGSYSFYTLTGELNTPYVRRFSTIMSFDAGSFYDGWRASIGVEPYWSLSADLELGAFYQYNRVIFPDRDQKFTAHIARIRVLFTPSTKLSASAFIQYSSSTDAVIGNIRLRYNPREGVDFYLVYNESFNTDRFRMTPSLPLTGERTILLKCTYTFNLK